MKQFWLALFLLQVCFMDISIVQSAEPEHPIQLIYAQSIQGQDPTQQYPVELLKQAFDAVGVSVNLVGTDAPMVQQRSLKAIAADKTIDVFWSLTNQEREELLLPVRIPIDKGLYGWRILLLAAHRATPLGDIRSLADLKQLNLLQGHDWPDTEILRYHHLNVQTSTQYQSLFTMLAKQRADAFPRSVLEVWQEIARYPGMYKVDQQVVIKYQTALYYFFHKDNQQLAKKLEEGLNLMIADGSFDVLFQQYFGEDIAKTCLAKRRVISIENPFLPVATPIHREELWFQPDSALCQTP